jgi:hypothetical protein
LDHKLKLDRTGGTFSTNLIISNSNQLHTFSLSKILQTTMLSSNAFRFVIVSLVSLSANAEYVRGTQRRLDPPVQDDKEAKVELLSAGNYVILAKSGISTVPTSVVTGHIAISPISAAAMTGFSLTLDSSGTFSTSSQIVGKPFAADYVDPIPSQLTTAVGAMETAYTDAAARDNADDDRINLGAGNLGGSGEHGGASDPLTPGVYTFGTSVTISENIYFVGSGKGNGQEDTDIFIIQMIGDLKQVANTKVILRNGALAKNIFWQVTGHGPCYGGRRCRDEGHHFGQNRRFVRDWFLPGRPRLGADDVQPPEGNDRRAGPITEFQR